VSHRQPRITNAVQMQARDRQFATCRGAQGTMVRADRCKFFCTDLSRRPFSALLSISVARLSKIDLWLAMHGNKQLFRRPPATMLAENEASAKADPGAAKIDVPLLSAAGIWPARILIEWKDDQRAFERLVAGLAHGDEFRLLDPITNMEILGALDRHCRLPDVMIATGRLVVVAENIRVSGGRASRRLIE